MHGFIILAIMHLSMFPPEGEQRNSHGELDNFEKLGSNSTPMGKYVMSKIPWSGHLISYTI